MGKKAGKKRPCHNRRKRRGGRRGQAPLGPVTTNRSTSLANPLPQRGQSNAFSPMAIDNEKTEWGPVPMSERQDIPPLVVRRKTARRNLNKQRAARRARQRAIKRKLAQAPKQPTITQKWVPKEHEESVVTVNMVGKAEKEGQNCPRNRFRHPSCSVV